MGLVCWRAYNAKNAQQAEMVNKALSALEEKVAFHKTMQHALIADFRDYKAKHVIWLSPDPWDKREYKINATPRSDGCKIQHHDNYTAITLHESQYKGIEFRFTT